MAKATGWRAFAVCASLACSGCASTPDERSAETSASTPTSDAGGVASDSARARPVSLTFSDPQGDVMSTSKEADWFEDARPVPRQAWGDIVGTSIQHTDAEVLVRVRFADPASRPRGNGHASFRLTAAIRTNPTGIERYVELWFEEEDPSLSAMRMLADGEGVSCHLGHSMNLSRGIATMRIPRPCLGDPQRVFVGVSCLAYPDERAMTLDLASVEGYDAAREDDLSRPVPKP